MDFFGTYFTHVQTYMITFVLTASVHTLQRSKPETTCVFEVLRNGLLRYILYTCPNLYDNVRVDCLGAYFTHVQTYMITFVLTASVHTLHMSKPMITFVFILPRNGLLNLIKLAQTHCFLVIRMSKHVHTFWRLRVFIRALKFLTCNVACAPCLFLSQNHKFQKRQKRMPKL